MSKISKFEDTSDIDSVEITPIEEDSSDSMENVSQETSKKHSSESFESRFERLEDIVARLENIDITPEIESKEPKKESNYLGLSFFVIFAFGIIGYLWLKNPQKEA